MRGTCPEDVRAEQVEEKSSSLNSDDAFYLVTNQNDYLWFGKVCKIADFLRLILRAISLL